MAPGEYGRAAHSQFQSGGKSQTTYQEGANFGSVSGEGSSVSKPKANVPTGYRTFAIDSLENRGRNRTPNPEGVPANWRGSKNAISRRLKSA